MTEDEIAKMKAELDVANARSRLAMAMIARLLAETPVEGAPTVEALAKLCVTGWVWDRDQAMTTVIREIGLMNKANPRVEDLGHHERYVNRRIPPVRSKLGTHVRTQGSEPEE